jgi:hypothetical protein
MNMIKISGMLLSTEQHSNFATGVLRFTPRGNTISLFCQDPNLLLAIPKISHVEIRGMLSCAPGGAFQITVKEIHAEEVKSERKFGVEGFNRMIIP